ncbi:MAG: hypothetical protein ABIK09_18690 [Pseudomonadota bacterium]
MGHGHDHPSTGAVQARHDHGGGHAHRTTAVPAGQLFGVILLNREVFLSSHVRLRRPDAERKRAPLMENRLQ